MLKLPSLPQIGETVDRPAAPRLPLEGATHIEDADFAVTPAHDPMPVQPGIGRPHRGRVQFVGQEIARGQPELRMALADLERLLVLTRLARFRVIDCLQRAGHDYEATAPTSGH
jgi:hypothetical protein